MSSERTRALQIRGVKIPRPDLVHISEEVELTRIAEGAVLSPGVTLEGSKTVIGPGARLGVGGPAVVRNCGIGANATISSGVFEDLVMLEGASFGPCGQARSVTIFEEGASAAHAVGVKQTILLPYATLGSNINFCDALLSGGTGPRDHSEVGSGFIHLNYTPFGPEGDKATASLFGDVVSGAFLGERRIFLGGVAGVVGPIKVGFGSVLAAGSIYRKDRGRDRLVYSERIPENEVAFDSSIQRRAPERLFKNLEFVAELAALRAFYVMVRIPLSRSPIETAILEVALAAVHQAAMERQRQLDRLVMGLPSSAEALARRFGKDFPEALSQTRLVDVWQGFRERVCTLEPDEGAPAMPRALLQRLAQGEGSLASRVSSLQGELRNDGIAVLRAIRDAYLKRFEGLCVPLG